MAAKRRNTVGRATKFQTRSQAHSNPETLCRAFRDQRHSPLPYLGYRERDWCTQRTINRWKMDEDFIVYQNEIAEKATPFQLY